MFLRLLATLTVSVSLVAAMPVPAGVPLAPGVPSAQPPAMKARYDHAKWTYPGPEAIAEAYPRRAQDQRIQGVAAVTCYISPDGQMSKCLLLGENPPREGFGDATVTLFTKYGRVDPATVDGGIQDGDFKVFTLNWQIN